MFDINSQKNDPRIEDLLPYIDKNRFQTHSIICKGDKKKLNFRGFLKDNEKETLTIQPIYYPNEQKIILYSLNKATITEIIDSNNNSGLIKLINEQNNHTLIRFELNKKEISKPKTISRINISEILNTTKKIQVSSNILGIEIKNYD